MDNPFLRRAAEYLRDTEAFLGIVSPEPARTFLSGYGQSGQLYDRLILLRGTPGSGKTTLARLFDYETLVSLLRNQNLTTYGSLLAALTECAAITDSQPRILACRLPMEADYRDIWEFPYTEELRLRLTVGLIQARAVLGWGRNLAHADLDLANIAITPRPNALAATDAIGGQKLSRLVERAKLVEAAIYKLVGALVAPPLSALPAQFQEAYHPFDVIESIHIPRKGNVGDFTTLRPLVILDDAHVLHPTQFRMLQNWLTRREMRVARWVLTRIDVMHPREAFSALTNQASEEDLPGITSARDTIEIMLQSEGKERSGPRTRFRRMAKDMADRYLKQMSIFSARKLESLGELLQTEAETLSSSKLTRLRSDVDSVQIKLGIASSRREAILTEVNSYKPQGQPLSEDLRWMMLRILMYRYIKRVPQTGLFEHQHDPDPNRPLKADATVYDAARLHLLHEFDRPYYYGIDVLCDAGSENAEQFLHLAATLVEASATQLIRARSASLDARIQHLLLRQKAGEIIKQWSYPQCELVSRMVKEIAERSLDISLAPNAWIGAGANAYGISQAEFDALAEQYPELARTVQFGLAYNALRLVQNYECKGQSWALLELGGVPILHYGLTLKRGGFIEGSLNELNRMTQTS
jgi:hypothetical protein